MPGKCSTTDISTPRPLFFFFGFLQKCICLQRTAATEEIRKRFCVLSHDSGLWSGSRPQALFTVCRQGCYQYPASLLVLCLFGVPKDQVSSHLALLDLLYLYYFTCASFQRILPCGVFPCRKVLDYGAGGVSGTPAFTWCPAAWRPVCECELRSCFRACVWETDRLGRPWQGWRAESGEDCDKERPPCGGLHSLLLTRNQQQFASLVPWQETCLRWSFSALMPLNFSF